MEPCAQGRLHSTDSGHFFETDAEDLPPATRVVYASQAAWDQETGMIYGMVDDAAGVRCFDPERDGVVPL